MLVTLTDSLRYKIKPPPVNSVWCYEFYTASMTVLCLADAVVPFFLFVTWLRHKRACGARICVHFFCKRSMVTTRINNGCYGNVDYICVTLCHSQHLCRHWPSIKHVRDAKTEAEDQIELTATACVLTCGRDLVVCFIPIDLFHIQLAFRFRCPGAFKLMPPRNTASIRTESRKRSGLCWRL